MPSLFGTKKGGGDDDEEPPAGDEEPPAGDEEPPGASDEPSPDSSDTGVDVNAKLSLIDSLFGYILLEDDATPTPEQLMSQNMLRIICIVELVLITMVGYYYGAFSIVQKIYNKKWL